MLKIIFILIGFTATVVQSMLLRELVMVFAGSEFSLGIFFASWLMSVALGSWVAGHSFRFQVSGFKLKPETSSNTPRNLVTSWIILFFVLQIIAVLVLPLQILIIKGARLILNVNPGEMIPPFPLFYYPFLSLIPFGFIHGFQFALGCRIYSNFEPDSAKAIGKVYFYDAIGDMLGGFAFGYLFIIFFRPFQTWVFLLASSLLFFFIFSVKSGFRKISAGIIILSCLLVINVLNGNLSRFNVASLRFAWKGFNLADAESSKYGDLAVIKNGNLSSVYENGMLSFTNPDYLRSEEIVHFPMLEVPSPENVLILGDALSGSLVEILKYSPGKIDYVELDKTFVDLSSRHITGEDSFALFSPIVKIHNLDGRIFVKTYRGKPFDCIIVNAGRPITAVANRFYTVDFFREAANILSEKGVISIGIDSNENYLGPELRNFNGCIYNSIKKVFPYIVLIPGETLFIIAGRSPSFITSNPGLLSHRLKTRKIKTKFLNEYTLPQYLLPERINYVRSAIEEVDEKRLNRDFRPVSYYFNSILWGAKFRSEIVPFFWKVSGIKFWWFLAGLAILTAFFVLKSPFNKGGKGGFLLAVANAGLAGISIEIILIIGFQVLYGYLYNLIGIIIASFMLGLALGVIYITRHLAKIKDESAVLMKWQLGLGIYSLALAGILCLLSFYSGETMMRMNIRILFPLLTLIDGFFVGVVFPVASKSYAKLTNKNAGEVGGKLYAFDLIGACIGSLLVSIFIVPLYGILNALILIASLSFAVAIILKFASRKLHKI